MLIREELLRESEQRARAAGIGTAPAAAPLVLESPVFGVEAMIRTLPATSTTRSRRMPAPRTPSPLALEKRREHMAFGGANPSDKEFERFINGDDLVDEFFLHRAIIAARPVCRLVVRNEAGRELGYATGFLIAPTLLLTNWHVFTTAGEATHSVAEFEYTLDLRGDPVAPIRFGLQPDRFFYANRDLDYALVAVNPNSLDGSADLRGFGYHRLVEDTNKIAEGEWVTIIQHPGGDRRQYAIRDNLVIEKKVGQNFMWYQSDTAQGSSGAPAFNDSFQIVALHHMGKARQDENGMYVLRNNERVQSLAGIDESLIDWVANEGVRVSVLCASFKSRLDAAHPVVRELFAAMNGEGDIMTNALAANRPQGPVAPGGGRGEAALVPAGNSGLVIPVHLQLTVGYGPYQPPQVQQAAATQTTVETRRSDDESLFFEKLAQVYYERPYDNRTGYDPDFLGIALPLPDVDETLAATFENSDGETDFVIPYEHFSVVLNKQRRLAIFTASNVAGSRQLRAPGPGDFSRRGLSGIGENDQEKWITDERVPEKWQLPDKFFTKDRQAFDKGHIVRREDVCWGESFQQVRRANGDTYHTPNCSPQVKGFNQSQQGGVWGQLENLVLGQAKKQNHEDDYTLLAGPVLADDDEVFDGFDDKGPVQIQIPRRFWKIVVDREGNDLRAFAFILEQDLSNVRFTEAFTVPEEWGALMISVQDLEDLLTGVTFPQALKGGDQFDTVSGQELATAANIRRRARAASARPRTARAAGAKAGGAKAAAAKPARKNARRRSRA